MIQHVYSMQSKAPGQASGKSFRREDMPKHAKTINHGVFQKSQFAEKFMKAHLCVGKLVFTPCCWRCFSLCYDICYSDGLCLYNFLCCFTRRLSSLTRFFSSLRWNERWYVIWCDTWCEACTSSAQASRGRKFQSIFPGPSQKNELYTCIFHIVWLYDM